jgi:DNA-binding XRE family transcriptional regulator
MTHPEDIRLSLAETRTRLTQDLDERNRLIYEGDRAGILKTDLAKLAGVSRQSIYDLLAKEETSIKQQRLLEAAGEIEHRLGQVVEDRWGLRWRADVSSRTERKAWQCRSVGLKVWLTGGQLAERGPLTAVRVDPIFTSDPETRAQRREGQAEDEAVKPDLTENPEEFDGKEPNTACGPAR